MQVVVTPYLQTLRLKEVIALCKSGLELPDMYALIDDGYLSHLNTGSTTHLVFGSPGPNSSVLRTIPSFT